MSSSVKNPASLKGSTVQLTENASVSVTSNANNDVRAATCSSTGTIALWDANSGGELISAI